MSIVLIESILADLDEMDRDELTEDQIDDLEQAISFLESVLDGFENEVE